MFKTVKTAISTSFALENAVRNCVNELQSEKLSNLFVFLVSPNYKSGELRTLHKTISRYLHSEHIIGAIVQNVDQFDKGFSLSCVKTIDAFKTFHIDHEQNGWSKHKAVGRWPEMNPSSPKLKDSDLLDFKSVSMASSYAGVLPPHITELKDMQYLHSSFFLLTGKNPHSQLDALSLNFPRSSQIGLIGTMTPFSTGFPTTLYHNDRMLTDGGMVGAFMHSNNIENLPNTPVNNMNALKPLGNPHVVTRCRGNVILEIDELKAAKQLLALLEKEPKGKNANKDYSLYLKAMHPYQNDGINRIHRVTSGDPSKGTLAIDTTKDVLQGTSIQFMVPTHEPISDIPTPNSGIYSPYLAEKLSSGLVSFAVSHPDSLSKTIPSQDDSKVHIRDGIYAISENGFIIKSPDGNETLDASSGSYICDIPYSSLILKTNSI